MRQRSYPASEEEVSYWHSLLAEEITEYDCGTLCRQQNGGTAFCCHNEFALPWLYRAELKLLSTVSQMWTPWKPQHDSEKLLKKEAAKSDIVYATCRGEKHCERDHRSISCRVFPLEPYIDKRGVFSALIFMQEFRAACPLSDRPSDIRQEYIDAAFTFWEKLLLRRPEDFYTYELSSRALRKEEKKAGESFPLLFPSWITPA